MRKTSILIVMVFILTGHSLAQTDVPASPTASRATATASPTEVEVVPDYLTLETVEILFPASIQFTAQLTISQDDLDSASVRLSQDGWAGTMIEADISSENGFTQVSAVWEIPTARTPLLFTEIEYQWRFVRDDETGVVEGSFVFEDARVNWSSVETANGRIAVSAPRSFLLPDVEAQFQQIYDRMSEDSGESARLNLVVYPQNMPLETCDGTACTAGKLERLYDIQGYTVTSLSAMTPNTLELVAANLFDAVYDPTRLPAWFRYGLIRYYTPVSGIDALAVSRAAVRTGALRDLENIPADPTTVNVWRAQAYGLVLYSAQFIGASGLAELANAENFDEAYEEAMRQPLNTVILLWSDWVFSITADEIYGYNVYESDIPTLEATEAFTPISLVPTKTPTSTSTETPTPTVTGILSATPGPTLTRTPTFTPSVTPRPAGSVNPTPEAPVNTGEESSLPLVGVILIGAGILLTIIVLLLALREGRVKGKTTNEEESV